MMLFDARFARRHPGEWLRSEVVEAQGRHCAGQCDWVSRQSVSACETDAPPCLPTGHPF